MWLLCLCYLTCGHRIGQLVSGLLAVYLKGARYGLACVPTWAHPLCQVSDDIDDVSLIVCCGHLGQIGAF